MQIKHGVGYLTVESTALIYKISMLTAIIFSLYTWLDFVNDINLPRFGTCKGFNPNLIWLG